MSVTRRGLHFTLSMLLLLLLAESLVIAAGQVLMLDKIHPSFQPYAQYLPGNTRPAEGCTESYDWEMAYYGIQFTCVYTGRDELHVYGGGGIISGIFITFQDVRAGDVLVQLGEPLPLAPYQSRHSRSRYYEVTGGVVTYFTRPMSLFARQKYLSFWQPIPTPT